MIGLGYLQKFWLTLSTPRYYLLVIQETLFSSLGFLLLSCLWFGSLNALFFTQRILPTWQATFVQILDQAVLNYPASLQITWDMKHLRLQPSEKLTIPLPKELQSTPPILPTTLALILPEDAHPLDLDLTPAQTLAVITPDTLYLSNQQNWNQLPLRELPGFEKSFTITQTHFLKGAEVWREILSGPLNTLRWSSFLLAPVILSISSLWTTLLNAVLIFYILRVGSLHLKFQTTLKLSAHVVVASLLVTQLQQWLYPSSSLPLASFAYWIYMTVIIFVIRRQALLNQLKQAIGKK